MEKGAFSGLKVADFSWVQAGPHTGSFLADFGAIVIRVESKAHPDLYRISAPYKDNIPGVERGPFLFSNTNKYSMTLDLSNPKGVEMAKRLIGWADVVIESFRPGTMKRWGLDYESLTKINEDIILLSMSIQGQTGIFSQYGGLGPHLMYLVGLANLIGWPDRDPVGVANGYTDWITTCFAMVAVVTALEHRRKTGKGQHIDINQYECSASMLAVPLIDYFTNNKVQERLGNRHPYAAPHGVYHCEGYDEWCTIAVFEDTEWQALCQVMGRPDLTEDPRFTSLEERKHNEDELDNLIEGWTTTLRSKEVMEKLQNVGVAAGQVKSSKEVREDTHLAFRQFFRSVEHPEVGAYDWLSWPFRLSETTPKPGRSPCFGEHNHYFCKEFLSMSEDEFLEFLEAGAFET